MCPLRIILIFLSATLAGFFVLRNLKSHPTTDSDSAAAAKTTKENNSSTIASDSLPLSFKVCEAITRGFWTAVDMASGRYLWRNLIGNDDSSSASNKRAD